MRISDWSSDVCSSDLLRGDNGVATGGLAVDTNQGWKGPEKYVATVPQVFDLWADPQERYDIFMNNYTERTWTLVTINQSIRELMKRSEEHTSELQSLMRISYAVFCLKKKPRTRIKNKIDTQSLKPTHEHNK